MRETAAVVANATVQMVRLGLLALQNGTNVTNQPSPKSDDSSMEYAAIGGGVAAAAIGFLATATLCYRNRTSLKNRFVGMFKKEAEKPSEESPLTIGEPKEGSGAVDEKTGRSNSVNGTIAIPAIHQ